MTFEPISLSSRAALTLFLPGSWTAYQCHRWCRKRYTGLYTFHLSGYSIMVVIG